MKCTKYQCRGTDREQCTDDDPSGKETAALEPEQESVFGLERYTIQESSKLYIHSSIYDTVKCGKVNSE